MIGKYLRPYLSIPMRSTSSVGDAVGIVEVVGDHVGSDDGIMDELGLSEGFIDDDGRNVKLGLLDG